ncbi:MAG: hypothetical protein R3F37_07280 [Candidatus Competibacteraceae bacterium]
MPTHSRLTPLNAALLLALGAPAQAATFDIDSCDATALINAIDTANGNGQADVINLSGDCVYTLTSINNVTDGSNGLPSITSTITINGNGATIERSSVPSTPDFRLIHIAASGDLTLDQLTVQNGLAIESDPGSYTDSRGGGFLNRGTATLTNSTLLDNKASVLGGGFANTVATATLTNSTLSDNSAAVGGGFSSDGKGEVTLNNSTLSGNSASAGGDLIMFLLARSL